MTGTPRLSVENVSKRYGEHHVQAVVDVSFAVEAGEFIALMGPSGCGKTTLLNLVAGIDKADAGRVLLEGKDISAMTEGDRTSVRREKVGFVFQFFNLLSTLTVEENVALPLQLAKSMTPKEVKAKVHELLSIIGLGERVQFFPAQLSGGEMQRTAIARAIVHKPIIILADEPTGNLDTATGDVILSLLHKLSREEGHTILMATHSADAAGIADRTITMKDGRLVAGVMR